MGLSGIYAYVSPKENLDKYKAHQDRPVMASTTCVGRRAADHPRPSPRIRRTAIGLSGYYAAWCLIANAPATKTFHLDWCILLGAVCAALLECHKLSGFLPPCGANGLYQKFMRIRASSCMAPTSSRS